MNMKEIINKIWSCDDTEALRNGLLLCIEHIGREEDTLEKRGLLKNVSDEIS